MQTQPSLAGGTGEANGSTRKPRKTRGRGLRVNTGCLVCRKRHMKCDEVKPLCGQCTKAGRNCVYGGSSECRNIGVIQERLSLPELALVDQAAATSPKPRSDLSDPATAETRSPLIQRWTTTPVAVEIPSPHSNHSGSTAYGVEVAPLRWYSLLAGDAASEAPNASLESLNYNAALAHRYGSPFDRITEIPRLSNESPTIQSSPKAVPPHAASPGQTTGSFDERRFWQADHPLQLKDHELTIFERFVIGVSLWLDLFDPKQHYSTYVCHLAIYNEGLMKAILALSARHLSIKPPSSDEASQYRTAAVQYYYETLKYLQSAMRFITYKSSLELLATVLVVSTYEMIDGAGQGNWERHLKGVFWIQRSLDINGESGGLQQAIWWSWIRQDVWAAFREQRRCFSFFKPTKAYDSMDVMDKASRVIYLLAQSVNYSSQEEKQAGKHDLGARILQANMLLELLHEWKSHQSIHFEPLHVDNGPTGRPFRLLWIHPPAVGAAVQMCSMARILLLVSQPSAGGYLELLSRERAISDEIETIGGIASKVSDDAAMIMSTQCLFAAGLYCADEAKRYCIAELIEQHSKQTGWPPTNTNLAEELRQEWAKPSNIR